MFQWFLCALVNAQEGSNTLSEVIHHTMLIDSVALGRDRSSSHGDLEPDRATLVQKNSGQTELSVRKSVIGTSSTVVGDASNDVPML